MKLFQNNIKKAKRAMLKEKEDLLLKYRVTEEYLIERIDAGEDDKRPELITCQEDIDELEKIIKFLKNRKKV